MAGISIIVTMGLAYAAKMAVDKTREEVGAWIRRKRSVRVLVLGRPAAGKSMLIRAFHGEYAIPSTRQTVGVESLNSWSCVINDKTIEFAKSSDIGGTRVLHDCQKNEKGIFQSSVVEDLIKEKNPNRIFYVCNIKEYSENKIDESIKKKVQVDVLERIGQIERLKIKYAKDARIDIIFSYIDCIANDKREKTIQHLKSQLSSYAGVTYHEVNFMDEESTKQLISKLF